MSPTLRNKTQEEKLDLVKNFLKVRNFDAAEENILSLFRECRFLSFENGRPNIRFSVLFSWRKNQVFLARLYLLNAEISIHAGHLAESQNELLLAIKTFEEDEEEREELIQALLLLGLVYRLSFALESSEECLLRAKDLAERMGNHLKTAESFGHLGMLYDVFERPDESVRCHFKSLEIYQTLAKSAEEAAQHRHIGLLCHRQGQKDKAFAHLSAGLEASKQAEAPLLSAQILFETAELFEKEQELSRAEDLLKTAEKFMEGLTDPALSGDILFLKGRVRKEQDKPGNGFMACYLAALEQYKKTPSGKAGAANVLSGMGLAHLREGNLDEAESCFKESMRIEEEIGRWNGSIADCMNLSLVFEKRGNIAKALDYAEKAGRFAERCADQGLLEKIENERKRLLEIRLVKTDPRA